MTHREEQVHLDRPLRLLIEIGDGRAASALLENGFLSYCRELGAEVHVLTAGAFFEPFIESYRMEGVHFSYLSLEETKKMRYPKQIRFERRVGNRLVKMGLVGARRALWQHWGERLAAADGAFIGDVIDRERPDCFITTNVNLGFSRGIMALCRRRGIPTLGNIFSWDHPFRTQPARPDRLTCWSEIVKKGLVEKGVFLPEQIEVIGAPIFDPYFDPQGICTREELCEQMGLDPARPILLFATLGQLQAFWDETGTFRAFLDALDRAELPGPPQVVLRLHPMSVDHYFSEFRARRDVVFSRYNRYCPGMRWWPSRDEIFLAGNLLRHADVCISPGSTMSIETAIFDTPTIVPTFNPMMSEDYKRFFDHNWLNMHFKFLVQEECISLAPSPDELIAQIQKALADPSWLSKGHKKIREQLLGPLDGHATERFAKLAVKCASDYAAK